VQQALEKVLTQGLPGSISVFIATSSLSDD
jgi:hypothetical protein